MPIARQHAIARPKILIDRFGFCRRFDDDHIHGVCVPRSCIPYFLVSPAPGFRRRRRLGSEIVRRLRQPRSLWPARGMVRAEGPAMGVAIEKAMWKIGERSGKNRGW